MADLLTFWFARRRRLVHAGKVTGPSPFGGPHVALELLCGTGRGITAWTGNPPATLESVTCIRCLARLPRARAEEPHDA